MLYYIRRSRYVQTAQKVGDNVYGRRKIFTDYSYVDEHNIVEILRNAYNTHLQNRTEISTLYDIYKGKQEILNKTKDIRPNINHKVCVNHANEIVSFKLGYTLGEPIQYIRRGDIDLDEITTLNDYMVMADKVSADRELGEWLYICGVGYRMTLPSEPFDIYTLNPMNTFIVYHNGLGEPPLMAVNYVVKQNNEELFSIYTENKYYEIEASKIIGTKPLSLGMLPIVEYNANTSRLGSFEIVLPLLDAINELESNRLDDVVQFVNSFLCISGATLDEETFNQINAYKMLGLPENSDAKYLSANLSQADLQTLKDNLYNEVLAITGLPSRNNEGGGSSDNGIAVYLRSGYSQAETQALAFEQCFKRGERKFLNLVLRIMRDTVGTKLEVKDLDIKFARRYTDNILTKTQAMIQLLDAGIEPSIAIASVGLWNDAYSVYEESKPYLEKWSVDNVRDNGQDIEETQITDME